MTETEDARGTPDADSESCLSICDSNFKAQYILRAGLFKKKVLNLTFVYPGIASIIINDDQQYVTILAYLFIHNQLYMFRAMFSPIIRIT